MHSDVCKHAIFVCVCVCVLSVRDTCWGAQAWRGVLLLHSGLCGTLWSGVDLVGLSSGAQTKPVQDYPPRDKVCDYHEKTASSSPIPEDCQACWRGGPPLISCREKLNAGAHSVTRTQENTMAHTHTVNHMLILLHMCMHARVQSEADAQQSLQNYLFIHVPFILHCVCTITYSMRRFSEKLLDDYTECCTV